MSDQQENDMCPLCEHEFYNSEIAAIREENARLRLLFAKYRDAIASIHRSDWSDDVGDFTRHTEEDDCWICDLIVPVDAALASACHVPVRGRARAILADEPKEDRGAEGPEIGDLVAYRYGDWWKIDVWCVAHDHGVLPAHDAVVLERRAKAERRIEEGK